MDYVVKQDGSIVDKNGRPYTGYIRETDWHQAVARGRRPVRPPISLGYWPKSMLRSQGQPHHL